MLIVTLDLGTTTAWCRGDTTDLDSVPTWGCWKLAGAKDLDASFIGLHNEICDLIDTIRPAYLVYETPLTHSARDSSRNIVDLLVGLAAVTRLTARLCQVRAYEQGFAEARKLVVGRGTFQRPFRGQGKISPKTGKLIGDAKEEVRLWTEEYGWGAIDHPDARDAAVLFRYAQMISKKTKTTTQINLPIGCSNFVFVRSGRACNTVLKLNAAAYNIIKVNNSIPQLLGFTSAGREPISARLGKNIVVV